MVRLPFFVVYNQVTIVFLLSFHVFFCCKMNSCFIQKDKQVVWTDKSSQTDKLSDVKTEQTDFQTTYSSEFDRLFFCL